ncbi:MAG: hypothetical protein ACFCUM_19270 [Bacteroidales bacterium]
MKKFFTFFIFILVFNLPALYSQIVVSLHTEGDAGQRIVNYYYQSDGFQKAYADAANGDTIYLPGGAFAPPLSITKQLVIYGAGHYPDATTETGKTYIDGEIRLAAGADHLHLEGLHIMYGFSTLNNVSVNHIRVVRCFISGVISIRGDKTNPSTNISFIGSVLGGTGINYFDNINNLVIHNSIIGGRIFNSEANLFSNNIFFFTSNNAYIFNSSDNNTIRNSIFYHNSEWYFTTGSTGNKWYNNIIPASTPRFHSTDTDEGNHKEVAFSPVFVRQNGGAFSYADDYNLVNPLSYPGTDGNQVGLYGGVFPYREMAVTIAPYIKSSSVGSKTDAEGKIEVEVTVEAQNEN